MGRDDQGIRCSPFCSVQEVAWRLKTISTEGQGLAYTAPSVSRPSIGYGVDHSGLPHTEPQPQIIHREYSSEKYSFVSILTLPAEIRARIYEFVFPEVDKDRRQKDTRHNVLLTYCHIYEESLHLYYSSTMLKMALYPLHFYHMNPQVRPAWSKIRHLFVNFLDTWNFTAAVLEELLPVLQTAVVEHAHFRPATGGMRYANMSDQDVIR